MSAVEVKLAEYDRPEDARAIEMLTDAYARDPMGGGRPLAEAVRRRLLPSLKAHPQTRVLLAWLENEPVGIATCVLSYSTFGAASVWNIHDLAVLPHCRGQGVGEALIRAAESQARRAGCCKMTLEVRSDNPAQRLYRRMGFGPDLPEGVQMWFWQKKL